MPKSKSGKLDISDEMLKSLREAAESARPGIEFTDEFLLESWEQFMEAMKKDIPKDD